MKKYLYKFEPYWGHLLLVVFGIIILFLIWANILQDFLSQFNNTQRILLSTLLSAIIAIFLLYFGFKANNRLQYFRDVKALIDEMRGNYEKIVNFPIKFNEAYGDCDNIILKRWIEKSPSYTNWGDGNNFHLKVLPSQAYFNFINKGHINQKEYLQFPAESIAHCYQFSIEFGTDLQLLENAIRALKTSPHEIIIQLKLSRFPEQTFHCTQEACRFLNEEVYPYYAKKNDLNDGIIGEYQKTIESLKDHKWLIQNEVNMGDTWKKWKDDGWNLGVIYRAGLGIIAIIVGFWLLSTFPIFSGSSNNILPELILTFGILFLTIGFTIWAGLPTELTLNKILMKIQDREK